MNRIQAKLKEDKKLISIYFSAGFPALNDTVEIIKNLEKSGVDMIEIGLPFSDPLADGPTIQQSSTKALKNGMHTELLFEQLRDIRKEVSIPLILMGYFNPILQYGVEAFCKKCQAVGIDGFIIPDLPAQVYHEAYKTIFERYGLLNIFLITPQTSDARIRYMDSISNGQYKTIAIFSKLARGLMTRHIVETKAETIEALKTFNAERYAFDTNLSSENKLVFTR